MCVCACVCVCGLSYAVIRWVLIWYFRCIMFALFLTNIHHWINWMKKKNNNHNKKQKQKQKATKKEIRWKLNSCNLLSFLLRHGTRPSEWGTEWAFKTKKLFCKISWYFWMCLHTNTHTHTHTYIYIYIYIRGAYDKFPGYFRMGI